MCPYHITGPGKFQKYQIKKGKLSYGKSLREENFADFADFGEIREIKFPQKFLFFPIREIKSQSFQNQLSAKLISY